MIRLQYREYLKLVFQATIVYNCLLHCLNSVSPTLCSTLLLSDAMTALTVYNVGISEAYFLGAMVIYKLLLRVYLILMLRMFCDH